MACSFCEKDGHNKTTCQKQAAMKQKVLQELQAKAVNTPNGASILKKFTQSFAENPQELTNLINATTRAILAIKS